MGKKKEEAKPPVWTNPLAAEKVVPPVWIEKIRYLPEEMPQRPDVWYGDEWHGWDDFLNAEGWDDWCAVRDAAPQMLATLEMVNLAIQLKQSVQEIAYHPEDIDELFEQLKDWLSTAIAKAKGEVEINAE